MSSSLDLDESGSGQEEMPGLPLAFLEDEVKTKIMFSPFDLRLKDREGLSTGFSSAREGLASRKAQIWRHPKQGSETPCEFRRTLVGLPVTFLMCYFTAMMSSVA